SAAEDVAQPLMSSLLHLHNEYNITDFARRRHKASVALVVTYPAIVTCVSIYLSMQSPFVFFPLGSSVLVFVTLSVGTSPRSSTQPITAFRLASTFSMPWS